MSPRRGEVAAKEAAPTFFLLAEPAQPGSTVELSPSEAHHALRVLRLESGMLVPATDGRGGRYRLRLLARGRSCCAEVVERTEEPPPAPRVEIGLGAGRRERFLWCVEKLTELEVTRVTPLLSATVQSRKALEGEQGRRFSERARARAAAALKQSKGTHLPEISAPEEPASWAAHVFTGRSLLLALEAPGIPPVAQVVAAGHRIPAAAELGYRLAVGPEGGFVDEEEATLVEAGFVPAHLGRRRLRFETAALVAVCYVRTVFALEAGAMDGRAWSS